VSDRLFSFEILVYIVYIVAIAFCIVNVEVDVSSES
jgi:hypothetical protein